MRLGTFAGLGLTLFGGFVFAQTVPAQTPSTKVVAPTTTPLAGPADAAIKERLAGIVKAYNARNAAGLSDFFTDDATLVDVDGSVVQGKKAITAHYATGFAQPSNYSVESTVDSIRSITADVAQVEGATKLTAPNEPSILSRFVSLVVKKDNIWKVVEIRDLPSPEADVAPADRLKELEWMVGDWVDQNSDMKIHSTIRWGENKAYLTRSTSVHVGEVKSHSSLMIVGWDPQVGQIRSWLFDSDGGRGEATWTRASDKQWILRAEGILRSGAPTSATQVVTLVGKDSVKTSSVDRVIGGEITPDTDEVIMVRKAPPVGGATPAGAATTVNPPGR